MASENKKIQGWHVTRSTNIESIQNKGLLMGYSQGSGRMWGDGVYVATDLRSAALYEYEDTSTLEVEVRTGNTLHVDLTLSASDSNSAVVGALAAYLSQAEYFSDSWRDKKAELLCRAEELGDGYDQGYSLSVGMRRVLGEQEIAIMHVHDDTEQTWVWSGGNQLVVFDETLVKVVA